MDAITVHEAEQNLSQLIENVLNNVEPTIILNEDGGKVVLLSLDEFNSWQETLYLLSTPANAEHLRQSIKDAQAGRTDKFARECIDETEWETKWDQSLSDSQPTLERLTLKAMKENEQGKTKEMGFDEL